MDEKIQNKRISLRIDGKMLQDINRFRGKTKSEKIKKIIKAGLEQRVIDNSDYTDIIDAIFELKTELAPIGSNLNQLLRYLNQGNELNDIDNIKLLDDLVPQFKELSKLLKYIQKELQIR